MQKFKWIAGTIVAGLLACVNLSAHGRVDAGPVYVHLDVLESGKTIDKLDMEGFRADGNFQIYSGFVLKPAFAIAGGRGDYYSGTLALGFYVPMGQLTPFLEGLCFLPHVGWTGSRLKTHVDLPVPQVAVVIPGVLEIFRSSTEFVGLETTYQLLSNVSVSCSVIYGWSNTVTTLQKETTVLGNFRQKFPSSSKGWSYSAMVDYQFTQHWSVNIAGVYNLMLSKENHGIRATGVRLGLGYCW